MFCLEQNEGSIPGDSIQRALRNHWEEAGGKVHIREDFSEGAGAVKGTFRQGLAASQEETMSQLLVLVSSLA